MPSFNAIGDTMIELPDQDHADEDQLARLGKQSVLRRNFSTWSILGFSCTILVTWEGATILLAEGLRNGGSAGAIYSFLFVWLGNISVFTCLSELISIAPTAGGQYHWVWMLAPPSCAKFLSYLTGWFVVGGWQGGTASVAFISSTMTQGIVRLTMPSYDAKPYQGVLIFWLVILICVGFNLTATKYLARFEIGILCLHVTTFIAFLIVPLVLTRGKYNDAHDVFTTFANGGNWPSMGTSFFIGTMGNVFSFVGVDAAYHLCEETRNPSVVVPRAILFSVLINGFTGFCIILTMLFCVLDVETALSSPTGFPFMEIYLQVTNSPAAATVMIVFIWIIGLGANIGFFAGTSRVFWSFARDHGLPGWRTLSKVHSRTKVPHWSVACAAIVACLLSFINLGSTAAFNDIISLSISSLYTSYFIVSSLLLYRRCTAGFREPDDSELPKPTKTPGEQLVWGVWRVPGVIGIINNIFACAYLAIIWVFSFWPLALPVTAGNMNFSILVTGAVALFSVIYYFTWGRREYTGPVFEIHHGGNDEGSQRK